MSFALEALFGALPTAAALAGSAFGILFVLSVYALVERGGFAGTVVGAVWAVIFPVIVLAVAAGMRSAISPIAWSTFAAAVLAGVGAAVISAAITAVAFEPAVGQPSFEVVDVDDFEPPQTDADASDNRGVE